MMRLSFFSRHFYEQNFNHFGIRFLGCGHYNSQLFKKMTQPRTINCYALVYLINGSGTFESEHCGITNVSSGDMFFLIPGEWHHYNRFHDEAWEEYWVTFEGPTIEYLMNGVYLSAQKPIYKTNGDISIIKLFSDMLTIVQTNNIRYFHSLSSKILSILSSAGCSYSAIKDTTPDLIYSVLKRVQENPELEYDFKKIANGLGMSYESFRKKVVIHTGFSPNRFHNTMRVNLSCKYLLQGYSVKEAALAVGFQDQFYFSRLFKKTINVSPKSYASDFI